MKLLQWFGTAMFFASAMACPASAGTPALLQSEPTVIPANKASAELRLPLDPGDQEPGKLKVELLDARHIVSGDTALGRFQVRLEATSPESSWPMIVISIRDVYAMQPGQYSLQLGLTNDSARVAAIEAKLAVPTGALELLSPTTVAVTLAPPFKSVGAQVAPKNLVFLRKAGSEHVRLDDVSLAESGFINTHGQPAGTLNAGPPETSAAKTLKMSIQPEGFPVGASTGHVALVGPGIDEAKSVLLTIQVRRHSAWVPILVLAGLVAGLMLRVVLQRRLDALEARSKVLRDLGSFQRKVQSIDDAEFQNALRQPLEDLLEAYEGTDPATMEQKLKSLVDALGPAQSALGERCAKVSSRVNALRQIYRFEGPWPSDVQAILARLSETLTAVGLRLEKQDAARAHGLLETEEPRLTGQTGVAIENLVTAGAVTAELDDTAALLVSENRYTLAARRGNWSAALAAAQAATDLPERAGKLLDAVAGLRRTHDWLAGALGKDSESLGSLALTRVREGDRPDVESRIATIRERLQAWKAFREQGWEPIAPARREAAAALNQAAFELVYFARSQGEPAQADTYAKALEEGRLHEALNSLKQDSAELSDDGGSGLRSPGRHPFEEASSSAAAPPTDTSKQGERLALPNLAALQKESWASLFSAQLVQAVVVGAIVVLVSTAIYAEKFIGTGPELVGLFFWGFSIDLTAKKLIELAGSLGSKPG